MYENNKLEVVIGELAIELCRKDYAINKYFLDSLRNKECIDISNDTQQAIDYLESCYFSSFEIFSYDVSSKKTQDFDCINVANEELPEININSKQKKHKLFFVLLFLILLIILLFFTVYNRYNYTQEVVSDGANKIMIQPLVELEANDMTTHEFKTINLDDYVEWNVNEKYLYLMPDKSLVDIYNSKNNDVIIRLKIGNK